MMRYSIGLGHVEREPNLLARERGAHVVEPLRRGVRRIASYNFDDIAVIKSCIK